MKKSILAMLLAAVMVLSLTACGEAAVSSSDVVEESSTVVEESSDVVEESTEAPAEESTEAPAEESTEAPAEESTEAPAEESTEAPAEESTEAPAEESTEAPAEESTEAPAEETPAAATTYTHADYSFTVQAGYTAAEVDGGIQVTSANSKDFYSLIVATPKAYAAFSDFTKDFLDPYVSTLFPGGKGSLISHEFSKLGSFDTIKATFKRDVNGVEYTEFLYWIDTDASCYQFEFLSTGDPAKVFAEAIASIKVSK